MNEQVDGGSGRSAVRRLPRPRLMVFDVNETLSDVSVMGRRFADVGAPSHLAATWFAGLLRDGFALTAAGGPPRSPSSARVCCASS